MSNKRHFARIHSTLQATVSGENKSARATVVDISLNGVLLESQDKFDLNTSYNIIITFDASKTTMTFDAKCTHEEGGHFGFEFTSEDIDSLTHLRRYLELNSDDGDQVARELPFLVKNSPK